MNCFSVANLLSTQETINSCPVPVSQNGERIREDFLNFHFTAANPGISIARFESYYTIFFLYNNFLIFWIHLPAIKVDAMFKIACLNYVLQQHCSLNYRCRISEPSDESNNQWTCFHHPYLSSTSLYMVTFYQKCLI